MMSSTTTPTSHFITLPNRPIPQENGEILQGPLKLHYWEWNTHGPIVLFTHGGSFHSRCYDRIIQGALSDFHVISLDFRGHGQSQKHSPPYKLAWFGEDTYQFIQALKLSRNKLIGIGHSLGGYSLTLAAAIASKRLFHSLLLLDPGIYPQSIYGTVKTNFKHILRRKNQWLSIDDVISKLEKREPYSRWPEDILRDYCTYALDENFKLACTPDGEASIYLSGEQNESNMYPLIKNSKYIQDTPIHVVRASISGKPGDLDTSPTAPDLAKWFRKGRDIQLKNVRHLFPMEDPQITIEVVKDFIKEYQ